MKTLLFSMLSAGWIAAQAFACGAYAGNPKDQALTLRVMPEREAIHRKGSREIIVQVELEGRRPEAQQRSPMNISVVLDRSTSMIGSKIEKARQAAALLVDRLDSNDIFSLVVYDSSAEVLIPAQRLHDRADRERVKARIFDIEPRGSTALYAGVELGVEQVRKFFDRERVNRVILLSDGQANVGPSRTGDLAEFGRKLRRDGMSVSTVGLGEDYNEDLMTALAESSFANYYYVQDAEKLPAIFAEELGAARTVLARSVTIRIEVPEGVLLKEILGHPEIRCEGRRAEITLPEYFGADRRKFLARCAVEKSEVETVSLANVAVKYEDVATKKQIDYAQVATVRVTDDEKESAGSISPEIAKEVAVVQNRIDKEEAVKLADTGKVKEAVTLLRGRAAQNAAAPVAQQIPGVANENRELEAAAAELENRGQFGKARRKQVQWENWQDKNQKRGITTR